jgi:hypothetical protein
MALIELLNNDPKFFYYSGQGNFTQKSIPFGNDLAGGGSSEQPFMQFPLPENAGTDTLNYYSTNKSGNDYPLRGGNGTNISLIGPTTSQAAEIDRSRIQKFLRTTKGNIFLIKQKYLQFANPKIEAGESAQPFNQQVGTLLQGGIEFTRIFNGGSNLLKQIGVEGSGYRYDRAGLVPVNPFQSKYEYVVRNKEKDLNRLVYLYKSKITTINPDLDPSGYSDLGVSLDRNLILEYPGGPDSTGGIGFTTIPRTTYTDGTDINTSRGDTNFGVYTLNYNQLSLLEKNSNATIRPDFRKAFNNSIANSNYEQDRLSIKMGTGDPGSPSINRVNYNTISTQGQDSINTKSKTNTSSNDDPWEKNANNDLIKFGFEAINYDDPTTSIFMQFRAFITNFTDNHQSNYNQVKYIGRGESFQVYDGFTREINFGFIIAAQSRQELLPLYDKLNVLVSQVYPDYSESSFMRTPVVKMTMGDYIYRQPGFLKNINLTVETDYPWEIKLDKIGKDSNMLQLPHVIRAECQFTPLHDFLPRKITSSRGTALFAKIPNSQVSNFEQLVQANLSQRVSAIGV